MIYTPRLVKPEKGNKYYNTKSNKGYSNAIVGKCKDTGKPDPDCNTLANCVGYAYGRFNEIGNYGKCKYLSPVNAENFPEYAKNCEQGIEPKLGAVIVWQKGKTLKGTDGAGHVAIVEKIISKNEILISQSGYNSKPFWTETIKKKNGTWLCDWMGSTYKFRCFIYNPAVTEEPEPQKPEGVKDLKFILDGKEVSAWSTNINSQNYIRMVDLESLGIVNSVSWNSTTKQVEVKTK